jgi:hypothetical protein
MQSRYRPDTYWTYVWHEMFDIEYEAEEMNINVDDIDIDYDAFKKDLWSWLTDRFIENLNDELPKRIQFVRPKEVTMHSPKYYNFSTDSINIELDINKYQFDEFLKRDKQKKWLDEYLSKYKSCDWFMSWTPSSYWELMREEDFERMVMCVLDYLLKDSEEDPMYWDNLYEIVCNNLIYPEKGEE